MVQNSKEEASSSPVTASPFIVQIIQTQGKSIAQLSKLNEELVNRTVAILDKFVNYDMLKIKQYDEFNRFLMEQKNIEKGILPPAAQSQQQEQAQQQQQINTNPLLEILSKLNFLKTPQGEVVNNPAIPPAHIPSSSDSQVHPDFKPKSYSDDYYNKFQNQMKLMQEEIDRLKKGALETNNDNAGNN